MELEMDNLNSRLYYLVYFYLGRCYSELNNPKEAIEYYKRSLASVESFPEAYYFMGLAYKADGKINLAMQNFDQAMKYLPYKMDEPFIERFDEVFEHMVEGDLHSVGTVKSSTVLLCQ